MRVTPSEALRNNLNLISPDPTLNISIANNYITTYILIYDLQYKIE